MILPDKIMSLFNVRHSEGKPLLFLLLYGFVLGGALLFLDTVSYTLFLLRFDADRLPYVFDRFGLKVAIIFLPFVLAIGLAVTLAYSLLVGIGGGFFVLIVGVKVINVVLTDVIDGDANLLLYQALPGRLRAPAQTFVGTIGAPVATGVAGGLLILLGLSSRITSIHLIGIALLAVAGWLALAIWVSREYVAALLRSLKDRALTGAALDFNDKSSFSVLQEKLHSPYPDEVIYVLNLVERTESDLFGTILLDLVNHPSVDVRRETLARLRPGLAGLDRGKALEAAQRSAGIDPSPLVRAAAFAPWAAFGGSEVIPALGHYVTDPDAGVRSAAIVALACHGGAAGLQIAQDAVTRLAASADPADRALAAQIGGLSCRGQLIHVAEPLLADPDLTVQRAALTAMGRAGDGAQTDVWRAVVGKLASPSVHRSASAALVAAGAPVLPHLTEAWSAWADQPVLIAQLARVLARINSPAADQLLINALDYPDELARTAIFRALRRKRGDWQKEEETIRGALRAEAAHGAWLLAAQVDLQTNRSEGSDLVVSALADRQLRTRGRLLDLLALVAGPEPVRRVEFSLAQASPEWRGNTLEVLDVLLGSDLKRQVLPLFESDPPAEVLARLAPVRPQPLLGKEARLRQILARPDLPGESWTQTVARYVLNPSALIPESLTPELLTPELLTPGASMLSTIERVIIS